MKPRTKRKPVRMKDWDGWAVIHSPTGQMLAVRHSRNYFTHKSGFRLARVRVVEVVKPAGKRKAK